MREELYSPDVWIEKKKKNASRSLELQQYNTPPRRILFCCWSLLCVGRKKKRYIATYKTSRKLVSPAKDQMSQL